MITVSKYFDQLNDAMIDYLIENGSITSPEVENAFRKVKRHLFVDDFVDPQEAYQDRAIMIKGQISSSSQPQIMSIMLENLEVKKGMKVLEIGTASGYNAALLAELTGSDKLVYTMEIETDLAQRASRILEKVGYPGVEVIAKDGRKGYLQAEPYDRILVTAETKTIYPELVNQLEEKGVFLAPFNFYDLITVLIKLYSQGKGKYIGPIVGFPVSFVPLRGGREIKQDREIFASFHKLKRLMNKERVTLREEEMAVLVLLLVIWHKENRLKDINDFQNLITYWKSSNFSGINEFLFEYDIAKKDWQIIPIFKKGSRFFPLVDEE